MFIAYIDSSGRPYGDPENYVLSSIIINEADFQNIDNAVKQLKLKHFPNLPDDVVEIHVKDMKNRRGIYNRLSSNEIFEILTDVFNLITNSGNQMRIIASLIDKNNLTKSIDMEEWGHRLLFERINRYIKRQNRILMEQQHPPQFCIMITDSEGLTKDQKLRKKLVPILRKGTLYTRLDYLMEDPLFTDSKWRNLSQLADCVAFCIRRHYRTKKNNFDNIYWEAYFKKIEPILDAPFGSYKNFGIKIFP